MSIIAICIAAYRTPDLGFDYQGVIVGILALLVTALITWQIYSLVDINGKKRDLEILTNETSTSVQRSMAVSENANWMIYHYLLLKEDPLGLDYRFIYHGVSCLLHTSQLGDIETCNVIVKGLLETIVDPSKIKILYSRKNGLIVSLSKVRDSNSIIGYNELMTKIMLIEATQPDSPKHVS